MFDTLPGPDEIALATVEAYGKQGKTLLAALDKLPAPIYVTDAEGFITYFNPACVGFTGRTPKVGKDRWCVTWKLYNETGEFMPHDQCPMADAIRQKRTIRGAVAVAERPDGTRVTFTPYPTPLFADDDSLLGAVNILIDVTEERQIQDLRSQVVRARKMAMEISNPRARETLSRMADEYQEKAHVLETMHKGG